VTNAWKNIQGEINGAVDELRGVAVCAAELPSMLPIVCVQPRRFERVALGPEVMTGEPAFDGAYLVIGQAQLEPVTVLTPAVTQRIAARDDWIFRARRAWLACVSLGPFASADEVVERIDDVSGSWRRSRAR
jgi:predicted transcriptional regulator